ncbi:MAG: 3-deoxy-D-manno-octulosonate 8-phosphate phosphatase [Bacteroidetes bacterium]|nr:MAG: 3-deoxy-D-manno-octulosonate 8-phosphate phosphatase [Bacteroidota bacterium]
MEHRIKAVLTDIDGVWTDGRIYLNDEGKSFKAFNNLDSVGVSLLRMAEIPVIIITGEDSEVIRRRAEQLKIKFVFTGARNKLLVAETILNDLDIKLEECAFIGDDLADLALLKASGFGAVPSNATEFLKSQVSNVLSRSGGNGAFREFSELVLQQCGILDQIQQLFLDKIASKNY